MRKPTIWVSDISDTIPPVQSQKQARSLEFWKNRDCTIFVAKTKALISCAVTGGSGGGRGRGGGVYKCVVPQEYSS